MLQILYRTNTYTGREDPFTTPWYALAEVNNFKDVLSNLCFLPNIDGTELSNKLRINYEDETILGLDRRGQEEHLKRIFEEYTYLTGISYKYAIWFTNKDMVISRTTGYGENLNRQNGGVLRCFMSGFIAYKHGIDELHIYEKKPTLQKDSVETNRLASKEEIEELLSYEKSTGKILAPTCLKKDITNALKRARNGLIGNLAPSYEVQQRARERAWDKIVDDML